MELCVIKPDQDHFKIFGPINFDTVSHVYKQGVELLQSQAKISLDFSQVTHADSSAIALLLSWLRSAKQKEKSFVFVNLPNQLLEIANVCEVLPIIKEHVLPAK